MKRILLLAALTIAAIVGYGQTPYKIQNPYLHQVWMGDTNATYIYPDSVVMFGPNGLPLNLSYDSVFIFNSVTIPADTNILFIDVNHKLQVTTPSAIAGSTASKWEYTGPLTLNPIDTMKQVAIGTNNSDGYGFRVDGTLLMDDSIIQYRTGNWAGFPFSGMYRKKAGNQKYLMGFLDLSGVGSQRKLFIGYIYDTLAVSDYTHRRIAINIDTIQGINIYSSNIPSMPNEGIHISCVSLSAVGVLETDQTQDTNVWELGRRHFDVGSNMLSYVLRFADSAFTYYKHPRSGAETRLFTVDTNGYVTINDAYTLPNTDGNANDVLTTDGVGSVSWQPASGGSSLWDTTTTSGNLALHPNDSLWDVAIGTTKMAGTEDFRVLNGAVLFDGTHGGSGVTPVSGAGTRLMWIPAKSAFRAGMVGGAQWDDANIGDYSAAFGGGGTTASGVYSFAAGASCTANGYAAAFGYTSDASGSASFAAGSDADATAYGTTAFGYGTRASAQSAFAIGESGAASGTASGAFNYYTVASGYNSFAANDQTTAGTYDMTAFGRFNVTGGTASSWVSTDRLFVIGNGTGTGGSSNDAFKVLKNGTTYIGDASSTQDAVLTVNTLDSTVTGINEVIALNKFVEYTPDHAYFTYSNNTGYTVLIPSDSTWVDATDSLNVRLTDKESYGFTFDNDTMVYNGYGDAHIKFDVCITVKAGNGDDWELHIYNITDGTEVDVPQICTTTGVGNYISMPMIAYDMNADSGDRYILQIRNLTNNDDPTIYRVMWYADVIHYK